MLSTEFATIIITTAAAFGTAAFTLLAASVLAARRFRKSSAEMILAENEASVAFLFNEETLVDATPMARAILAKAPSGLSDWDRICALFRHRFNGFDQAFSQLAEKGQIELSSTEDGDGKLCAEWRNGLARVVVFEDENETGEAARADQHIHAAAESELQALRTIVRGGPTAIWKQDGDGSVTWANEVYISLAEDMLGVADAHSWPLPKLFPVTSSSAAEPGQNVAPFRTALRTRDDTPKRWFECHGCSYGDEVLCYATPADNVVRAEEALREFVQTLSKTFADLPIGLAIFDRSRRLALFNPALTDLTALEIEFLSARPSLFSFLDHLRENRRIPEQRDYRQWRQRMAELEEAATSGFVQEDWTLPTGQTFRVTGRPHPDGALAFLFEDISAEISLTRHFRSEIELGQTVIDSFEEAIAVFSPSGTLTFSNAAYTALWGIDPSATLAEVNVNEATRLWQSRSEPNPIWGDARDYLKAQGDRQEWAGEIQLQDGPKLNCRFQPLSGGATLVGFSQDGSDKAEPFVRDVQHHAAQ